jgi:uncharacterized protein YndB with AHSA1/START domain
VDDQLREKAVTAAARKPDVDVTVTRVFDAPREIVFKAWTDPKQLAQWWGPRGYTSSRCEVDSRPGGNMVIQMHAPDGARYRWTSTFSEIDPPNRIVFTSSVADVDGDLHFEGLHTVTFEEQSGKTRLTVHSVATAATPIGAEKLKGMPDGWSQSLDRLADLVTTAR